VNRWLGATLLGVVLLAVILATAMLALGIGAAVYTAWILVTGTSSRSIGWPTGSYYAVVGACLALTGLAIVASARAAGRMVSGSAGGTVRFE